MISSEFQNLLCEHIAYGDRIYFNIKNKRFYLFIENEFSDLITGEVELIEMDSVIALPYFDLKQEAYNFIIKNKNLYWKDYNSLLHKYNDKNEAAWQLLIDLDDNLYNSDDFTNFNQYRIDKAEEELNHWLKTNIHYLQ